MNVYYIIAELERVLTKNNTNILTADKMRFANTILTKAKKDYEDSAPKSKS